MIRALFALVGWRCAVADDAKDASSDIFAFDSSSRKRSGRRFEKGYGRSSQAQARLRLKLRLKA